MKALLPSIILAGLLASCMNVDPLDSAKPEARLAFRLADSSGALRILASRTCSLKISFRAGTGSAHDTTLAFGSGRWLSPSVSASEDWRIDLIGIDSTGHRIWNGNASGKFQGTSTVATTLWTAVPVATVDSMQAPALSQASGKVDFPMTLTGTAPAGRAEWSLDSAHWHSFPDTGLILDSGVTFWARTRDTGTLPQPDSRCLRVELSAKQVARPKYSGTLIGLDFPLALTLDSTLGTTVHWSADSGRSWNTGIKIPMDRPGILKAYATRPHQPASDTLNQNLSGTVTPRTLTDARDGKVYKVVRIGTQVWMAQNLDYVTDSSWAADTSACKLAGSPSGCTRSLGRYYTWRASLGLTASKDSGTAKTLIQGICPEAWHLPAPSEWTVLQNQPAPSVWTVQQNQAATPEALAVVWPGSNAPYDGKDAYGFAAYPLAFRSLNGGFGVQDQVWFWSSQQVDAGTASAFGWPPYLTIGLSPFQFGVGLPVRCLKDQP